MWWEGTRYENEKGKIETADRQISEWDNGVMMERRERTEIGDSQLQIHPVAR